MFLPPELLSIIYDYALIIFDTEMEFFEKYIDKIDWFSLSGNPSVPLSFFEKHIDKVNWSYLSGNPSVPVSFFERNIDNLDWRCLSKNPSIPLSFVEKYIDKWNGVIYLEILTFHYLSLKNISIK